MATTLTETKSEPDEFNDNNAKSENETDSSSYEHDSSDNNANKSIEIEPSELSDNDAKQPNKEDADLTDNNATESLNTSPETELFEPSELSDKDSNTVNKEDTIKSDLPEDLNFEKFNTENANQSFENKFKSNTTNDPNDIKNKSANDEMKIKETNKIDTSDERDEPNESEYFQESNINTPNLDASTSPTMDTVDVSKTLDESCDIIKCDVDPVISPPSTYSDDVVTPPDPEIVQDIMEEHFEESHSPTDSMILPPPLISSEEEPSPSPLEQPSFPLETSCLLPDSSPSPLGPPPDNPWHTTDSVDCYLSSGEESDHHNLIQALRVETENIESNVADNTAEVDKHQISDRPSYSPPQLADIPAQLSESPAQLADSLPQLADAAAQLDESSTQLAECTATLDDTPALQLPDSPAQLAIQQLDDVISAADNVAGSATAWEDDIEDNLASVNHLEDNIVSHSSDLSNEEDVSIKLPVDSNNEILVESDLTIKIVPVINLEGVIEDSVIKDVTETADIVDNENLEVADVCESSTNFGFNSTVTDFEKLEEIFKHDPNVYPGEDASARDDSNLPVITEVSESAEATETESNSNENKGSNSSSTEAIKDEIAFEIDENIPNNIKIDNGADKFVHQVYVDSSDFKGDEITQCSTVGCTHKNVATKSTITQTENNELFIKKKLLVDKESFTSKSIEIDDSEIKTVVKSNDDVIKEEAVLNVIKEKDVLNVIKEKDVVDVIKEVTDEVSNKEAADDVINKEAADFIIIKEAANDSVIKEAANDIIKKEAANDIMNKEAADDIIIKEASDDIIIKKAADAIVVKEAADDIIIKEAADDEIIKKEAADDIIIKEAADDIVVKEAADDIINKEAADNNTTAKDQLEDDNEINFDQDQSNLGARSFYSLNILQGSHPKISTDDDAPSQIKDQESYFVKTQSLHKRKKNRKPKTKSDYNEDKKHGNVKVLSKSEKNLTKILTVDF